MLLTLLQSTGASPPVVPPPENTADIGPGDYSSIPKEFKLRGEVKRKRLSRSQVKKIKEAVSTPPSREQLEKLTSELLPGANEGETTKLAAELHQGLDLAMQQFLAGVMESQSAVELETKQRAEREKILISVVAAYLRMMEEDEILLAYLI